MEIAPRDRDVPLNTKIEFSRRGGDGASVLAAVESRLVRHYRLMPILANHYVLPAAIRQKLKALVNRREVQARDVFDLSLLFARVGDDLRTYADLSPQVPAAIDRVWELEYSDYRGQVVAYLELEHAEAHGSREAWEAIQLSVVDSLETIGRFS